MNKQSAKQLKRIRRHARVRVKVKGTSDRPRLTVFRSNRGMYLQLIDDQAGRTLASVTSREVDQPAGGHKEKSAGGKQPGGRAEQCFAMGKLLAEKAGAKKIKQVVFDRGGYKYHGLIKAVAEGARQGGLKF